MVKIVIINGRPRVGKSLFVKLCLDILGYQGREASTVDLVKYLAEECGWDGAKTLKNRKFLSDLKDLLTEWNDVPYKDIQRRKAAFEKSLNLFPNEEPKDGILFVHCREPEEIQKFKDRDNAITLLIRRAAVENDEQSNHADSEVFNFNYDYVIENNGTIEELEKKARGFLKLLNF